MNTRTKQILASTATALAISSAAPSAQANLLTDPSFEFNSLTTAANVLGNFSGFQGQWGVESATIVGPTSGVTPLGSLMLSMTDDSLITTQAFQAVDVSAYATQIDSGGAHIKLGAWFNVAGPAAGGPAAAGAAVFVQFFSAANFGSMIGGGAGSSLVVDTDPSTWEFASINTAIPIATRWMVAQVYYGDASLEGQAGFVDNVSLDIPEPGVLLLLAIGGLATTMGRRRQAR